MIRPVQPAATPSDSFEADQLRDKVSRLREILADALPANEPPPGASTTLNDQLAVHRECGPHAVNWHRSALPHTAAGVLIQVDRAAYAIGTIARLLEANAVVASDSRAGALNNNIVGGLMAALLIAMDQVDLGLDDCARAYPEID